MPACHYNRKLQPRGRSWILMKSSQANSQLRNQSQVKNIFSENQMDKHEKRQKTMGDSTSDGTFNLGACYDSMQYDVFNHGG